MCVYGEGVAVVGAPSKALGEELRLNELGSDQEARGIVCFGLESLPLWVLEQNRG